MNKEMIKFGDIKNDEFYYSKYPIDINNVKLIK